MLVRLTRWWSVLFGGVLFGAGLVLHGQLAFALDMREEVQGTFFLWRAFGQITFIFQEEVVQTALWLNEVPDRVIAESDRAAWTLLVVGALLAASSAFYRRKRKRRWRPNSARPRVTS